MQKTVYLFNNYNISSNNQELLKIFKENSNLIFNNILELIEFIIYLSNKKNIKIIFNNLNIYLKNKTISNKEILRIEEVYHKYNKKYKEILYKLLNKHKITLKDYYSHDTRVKKDIINNILKLKKVFDKLIKELDKEEIKEIEKNIIKLLLNYNYSISLNQYKPNYININYNNKSQWIIDILKEYIKNFKELNILEEIIKEKILKNCIEMINTKQESEIKINVKDKYWLYPLNSEKVNIILEYLLNNNIELSLINLIEKNEKHIYMLYI